MILNSVPVPFPCLRAAFHTKGPGRNKFSGNLNVCPMGRETE